MWHTPQWISAYTPSVNKHVLSYFLGLQRVTLWSLHSYFKRCENDARINLVESIISAKVRITIVTVSLESSKVESIAFQEYYRYESVYFICLLLMT